MPNRKPYEYKSSPQPPSRLSQEDHDLLIRIDERLDAFEKRVDERMGGLEKSLVPLCQDIDKLKAYKNKMLGAAAIIGAGSAWIIHYLSRVFGK